MIQLGLVTEADRVDDDPVGDTVGVERTAVGERECDDVAVDDGTVECDVGAADELPETVRRHAVGDVHVDVDRAPGVKPCTSKPSRPIGNATFAGGTGSAGSSVAVTAASAVPSGAASVT